MEFLQGNRACRLSIARLILQQTGTYNSQYLRPYDLSMDGATINAIGNRIQETGGGHVSGKLISDLAASSLGPTASAQAEIFIPNSFDTARVRFMLAVQADFNGMPGQVGGGTTLMYYFQGYTDHPGITISGAVDEQMTFYINSFIGVTRIVKQTTLGYEQRDMIVEKAQMLSDPNWSFNASQNKPLMAMRPMDVFGGIQRDYMSIGYDHAGDQGGIMDSRSSLKSEAMTSSRTNNVPGAYMANVIDNYVASANQTDFGMGEGNILSLARQKTYETNPAENPFIQAINAQSMMSAGNRFTMGVLRRIDPNVDNVTDVNIITGSAVQQIHHAGQSAYWNASDRLTQAAAMLAQAVPAIMIELMISRITVFSHNHDVTGRMDTRVANPKSLTGADISPNVDMFIRRLNEEVLFYMTFGNMDRYTLTMTADMFGETSIVISINSEPETPYVVPSFCDNLMSPVVTASAENYNQVVSGFESLVRNVSEMVHPKPGLAVSTAV